jgi:hypothetical protein
MLKGGESMQSTTFWQGYVAKEADQHGVPFKLAWMLFEMLGPEEAHDGFITALADYADPMEEQEVLIY